MSQNSEKIYDVFVAGGGINGIGVARDAAGRGYSVCLCEMNDFASGTSSNSTKLIHGGLRYLENYEFLLVNKLCKSRNQLMRSYPSIVKEIRFLTTIQMGTGEMVAKRVECRRQREKIEQVMSRDDISQALGLK